MTSLNWGIIGPGSIADMFADALVPSTQGSLYAVASRSLVKAQAFADKYATQKQNTPIAYGSYEGLLSDDKVDVVYIATPQSLHYQQAKMCLEAGKHVLMEKPLTINAAQTEQLIALAKEKNLLLQEGLWSRFMPCFEQVQLWLDEGRIGELQYICSDIGFAFGDEQGHRLHDPNLGGGALLDLGVYSITLSQLFMQEHPSEIRAMSDFGNHQVDENTLVNMRYPSGRFAQFTCTITAQASNSMTLMGSKGRIVLPYMFWNGNKAILQQEDMQDEVIEFAHRINGFEYQIEEAMNMIAKKQICSEYMPHHDSLAVMQTMDEIRRQIGLKFTPDAECV
ncbi:MAG: Gfo/Idh/MocA family oxidoreductase [Paraglaciecola polaris]|uniref:Gfo/Idh/MocA family protein n=1 Tax=Paraglaciecola polaris TaxID=222814 RepID=UPI00300130A9